MKNTTTNAHLCSTFLPSLPGIYLTAEDSNCQDVNGDPAILWSLSVQDGTGAILRRSYLDADMAEAIYRSHLEAHDVCPWSAREQWWDHVEDCRAWAEQARRAARVGDLYDYTENCP